MKVGCLISGGKDSIYAMYLASKEHEVSCLISLKPEKESWMFHIPNAELVENQAESIGLPLISMETKGKKEEELEDLKEVVKLAIDKYKIEGLVTGALASNYQKKRVDKICEEFKIKHIAPLWEKDPKEYMQELLMNKFKVVIVGVAADGLDESWLGKEIDAKLLGDLEKLNIHIAGEGGEYESFVLNCPLFKKELVIKESEKIMEDKYSGYLKVKKLNL